MKFQATILRYGDEALEFLTDPDMNFVIIFNENAPEELADISILHTKSEVNEPLAIGDMVFICGKAFEITAIGDEAPHTLKELGHCTICFKGEAEADRPGVIMVKGDEPLVPADIKAGETIEIH